MKLSVTPARVAAVFAGLLSIGAWDATGAEASKPNLSHIKVPEGFGFTLFAAPPEVGYPACIAVAPTGELFVGVDENGSLDREAHRGRIIRCVDTDNDGKADQFTTFVKDLDSPRGLIVDGKTVYVLHPPYLSAFIDEDGDGVAEGSEVLVSGIGFDLKFRGADHTSNGIQMGIDGWIYIAIGDYGFLDAIGRDGEHLHHRGGGIVRVRPDGSELEMFATGLRNIYDVAIDPTLNIFTRDNTNDGDGWDVRLSHIIHGANYGYPSLYKNFTDEIMPPLADYGGGSPTGALYVHEQGLPYGYGDVLYTCDWGRNKIYRHPMERSGATFKPGQEEFIHINRPTDMDVDGRARLYVSSWDGATFTYAGPNAGYVIRVTHPENKEAAFPDLRKASEGTLLRLMASSSHVARLHAQREILRRGKIRGLVEGLKQIAESKFAVPLRVASIFTLKQLLGPDSHSTLMGLLKDEAVREYALRALADRRSEMVGVSAGPFIEALKSSNPRVRLQGLTGLARVNRSGTADAILPLTISTEPVLAHTAIKTLVSLGAVEACLKALEQPDSLLIPGALAALREMPDSRATDGLLSLLERTEREQVRLGVLKTLIRLYYREADWKGGWWGTRPDNTGPYYERTDWEATPKIAEVLNTAIRSDDTEGVDALLAEMGRHSIMLDGMLPILLKRSEENEAIQLATVRILSKEKTIPADSLSFLEKVAGGEGDPGLRAQAFAALTRAEGEAAQEGAVRVATAFAKIEEAPPRLQRARQDFIRSGRRTQDSAYFVKLVQADDRTVRELAYAVLLQIANRKDAAADIKDAAEKAIAQAWDKPAGRAEVLRAVAFTEFRPYSNRVREVLEDANEEVRLAATAAAKALRLEERKEQANQKSRKLGEIPFEQAVAEVLKQQGDAKLGGELFVRQSCVNCHTVAAGQELKGPHLAGIAERYSRRELMDSIVRPSAQVAQGFETHWFETRDGERTEGFIVREAGDDIEIRNAGGIKSVLAKKDIVQRGTSKNSVMPEGLADNLTVEEMASLLKYLESLKSQ